MKFSLTKNKKVEFGVTLYQIKAEKDFCDVLKGDLGGWVEKKENLSDDGNAEVSGNARVYGKLKLLSGYFFGTRYQKEEIKYKELDDNYELIYKGDAKFGEDEPKETIKIGEYTYNKNEVETALKDLKTV